VGQRCVLGVDIGTSSSKGVLVTTDGAILGTATREHRVDRPHPGQVEMDAGVWWAEFRSISRELLDEALRTGLDVEVAAVGVSGMGPCVLLTDADGVPVRPAILYGVDTRSGAQVDRLERELGAEAIVLRGGTALGSQAAGPKIAWIAENEPESYARSRLLFMPASWLAWNLTGQYVLDHHSASQCWPLYDLEAAQWYLPWAEQVAPGIQLPRLLWADEVAGHVTAEASAATGLPAGIPVIAGSIDAWTEAVSAGAQRPGDLMLMYGTTMFLVATVAATVRTPSMWSTAGAFTGTRSLAGGMAASGAITSWLRDLFGGSGSGGPDYPELLAEAEQAGVGAHGLVMLPYFAGERTPLLDPDARGVIAGLTLSHTRGDLYRAALEATAFGVRHNVETMQEAGAGIQRVVAVGGGTRGGLWTRIVSDVTGLSQEIPSITIGASFGAAFLAACAIADGERPRIEDWNPIAEIRRPDPALAAAYDDRYRLYRELYLASAPVAHALAAAQRNADAGQSAGAQQSAETLPSEETQRSMA
jgi:xylulokinase